jgi:hypothetical protein
MSGCPATAYLKSNTLEFIESTRAPTREHLRSSGIKSSILGGNQTWFLYD